jgi:hypothetical protein
VHICDVFHVGLLKRYVSDKPVGPGTLPPIHHGRMCLEPEVSKSRIARGHVEVLVRWIGQPAAGASWMDVEEFRLLYSSFKLTNELVVQGREMLCVVYSTHAEPGKAPRR